jgi:hypothetical protein
MPAPSLLELIAASRTFALREAIVATLKPLFPECDVRGHMGKLDMADVIAGDSFRAPALSVAITRLRGAEHRMSGLRDVPIECTVYAVTEDQPLGSPPKVYTRDEIGFALCDGVLSVVENPQLARWGLQEIGFPEDASAQPLFTAKTFERGTAYYGVTWRQTLYGLGDAFWDMESLVPAPLPEPAPVVVLPGDPGFSEGEP